MKEKRSFKRFDLFAVLAVLGVIGVLLFESIFLFELYAGDASRIEPYLPSALKSYLIPVDPSEEKVLEQSTPVQEDAPAPVEVEEFSPVEAEEPEPVG